MPMHDWTRVDAGTFHAFRTSGITHLFGRKTMTRDEIEREADAIMHGRSFPEHARPSFKAFLEHSNGSRAVEPDGELFRWFQLLAEDPPGTGESWENACVVVDGRKCLLSLQP
jgi:hypothetical protein